MSHFWSSIILISSGLVIICAVFVKHKRSEGGTSSSLGILRAVMAFSLLIVLQDTINDQAIVYVQTQEVKHHQSLVDKVTKALKDTHNPVRTDKPAKNKRTKTRRRLSGRSRGAQIRNVSDAKYELLKVLGFLAFVLYILKRPNSWGFIIELLLAWRGKTRDSGGGSEPYEDHSHPPPT